IVRTLTDFNDQVGQTVFSVGHSGAEVIPPADALYFTPFLRASDGGGAFIFIMLDVEEVSALGDAEIDGATLLDLDAAIQRRPTYAEVGQIGGIRRLSLAEATALSDFERQGREWYFLIDGGSPGLTHRDDLPAFVSQAWGVDTDFPSGDAVAATV